MEFIYATNVDNGIRHKKSKYEISKYFCLINLMIGKCNRMFPLTYFDILNNLHETFNCRNNTSTIRAKKKATTGQNLVRSKVYGGTHLMPISHFALRN